MNNMEMRKIELRAVLSDTGEDNYFEGRACQYGIKDSYGTTFFAGCFTRGGLDDKKYSLLWMHDPNRPVGTFTAQEREDGLWIVGKWDNNTAGYDARQSALSGSAADLSVGFTWIVDSEEDEKEGYIKIARLQEVSQVTSRFAAVPGSVLTSVRSDVDNQGNQDSPESQESQESEQREVETPEEVEVITDDKPVEENEDLDKDFSKYILALWNYIKTLS